MPVRDGLPWLIDEYIIVGDMWLRRGRSVGSGDAEVKQIAAVLGRSPASVSRRVGNFAGTDNPGTGLKPITGEPREVWQQIRSNPTRLAQAVDAARKRLALLVTVEDDQLSSQRSMRVVAPERPSLEPVIVETSEQSRTAKQTESILREEFRKWRDPRGNRLKGIEIATFGSKLRVDLFDPYINLLIEIKSTATRDHLRYAIGQLYDYGRYLTFPVELAVLVPEMPNRDLQALLASAGVGAIWPDGKGSYLDTRCGHLLRTP